MYNLIGLLAIVAMSHVLALLSGDHTVIFAALAGFASFASYDQGTGTTNLDLSQEISAVLLADTFLLGRVPTSGVAKNVDHYWLEESLNAHYVTLAEALDDSETTVTVASATGVQVGALLMDESIGKSEIMQVTAISGADLTVVRGAGDSGPAAETHADASRLRIIARAKPEGDENVTDESKVPVRKHNVCQIFKKEIKISGTATAIDWAGVPNFYAHQLANRMLELKREFAMSLYAGVKITNGGAGGSDAVYRSMDGLRNMVRNNASQLDSTSQALSEAVMNSLYNRIYDAGGEANCVIGTRDQMAAFADLYKDKIRLAPSEKMRGVYVTKFLTELGVELDILIDRWALKGDALVCDTSKANFVPLNGRALQSKPLKESGDALIGMMVGEYTLEFRNAGECAALASNLTARA